MYKYLVRPLFFLLSPERAHHLANSLLHLFLLIPGIKALLKAYCKVNHPLLKREVCGITFDNPIGLAAGFDKNAELYSDLFALGFGFIEIGTVTPKPQSGNPKPRMFRLKADHALINRMGFNNEGVESAIHRLKKRKKNQVIGGNIGKNKVTPNERALEDYHILFESMYPHVDYFVINVSSPNTPGLRELQEKGPLLELVGSLMELRSRLNVQKPIFLKIAPDLNTSQLDDIIEIVRETKLHGVIATNTTISRDNLRSNRDYVESIGAGGISGDPVKERSTEVIQYLHDNTNGGVPIIGVGGVRNVGDVIAKLEAGAQLVQVYTGFIYEGPFMIRKINKALIKYFKSK